MIAGQLLRLAYGAAGRIADGLTAVAPAGDHKVIRSFAARRGALDHLETWAQSQRDPRRPLVWMHAPSVGEGLQARPVLSLLRARRPDVQLVYTHFSPSAERFAAGLDVDCAGYLPFDTAPNAQRLLAALRPTALVFAKLDVWPILCETAAVARVPVGLVSATLPESSARRSRAGVSLLKDAYRSLASVGAISADDADRLVQLGVDATRIAVTGDTRYDQVWERAAAADGGHEISSRIPGFNPDPRPTLVAGSTWPADEKVLLPAWSAVREQQPDARLVIAPHEPHTGHLDPIRRWVADRGLKLASLSEPDESKNSADVVLVDRLGVLGDLYWLGNIALVGGAFHGSGIHSVLEPAAFGVPVIFGPRHQNSRDPALLLAAGGAAAFTDAAAAARVITGWFADPATARAAGDRAREVVRQGLGAAERSFDLVLRLIS
ncbi:MAG: 3-deoxy-D-manno-octulosonic acid transferase [Gemmatimonadota bacterium]